MRYGLAVPCFAEDPAELAELGASAERAGFDGYFLWDHLVFDDTDAGPPVVDPWQVLALVAVRTQRIRIGTMITPVPRRRPWKLARELITLDRLSAGRVIFGAGIGSPPHAEFGLFGEPTQARQRAELLDEGLAVLAGLCSGERFSHRGQHFAVGPVRFVPAPVQRPGSRSGRRRCCRRGGRSSVPPAGTVSCRFTPAGRTAGRSRTTSWRSAPASRNSADRPPDSTSRSGTTWRAPPTSPVISPATLAPGSPGGWTASSTGPAGWT